MRIKINGSFYVYEPNFIQSEWKMQAGAYFKYPVQIGDYLCFVKRFLEKPCGWDFVTKLIGETHTNLPQIYAASLIVENTKPVYYLITEFVSGNILSDRLAKKDLSNVKLLSRNVIQALKFIHSKGFWFADFCEKNIYWAEQKNIFILIDLDSCEPIQNKPSPQPNTPGYIPGQEFANWTISFFKDMLNVSLDFSTLNGDLLNFCQLVFLVAKISLFKERIKSSSSFAYPQISSLKEPIHTYLFNKNKNKQEFVKNIFKKINQGLINIELIDSLCKETLLDEEEKMLETYLVRIKELEIKNEELETKNKTVEDRIKNAEEYFRKQKIEEIKRLKEIEDLEARNNQLLADKKKLETGIINVQEISKGLKKENQEITFKNDKYAEEKAQLIKLLQEKGSFLSKKTQENNALSEKLQEKDNALCKVIEENKLYSKEILNLIEEIKNLESIVSEGTNTKSTVFKESAKKYKRQIAKLRKQLKIYKDF